MSDTETVKQIVKEKDEDNSQESNETGDCKPEHSEIVASHYNKLKEVGFTERNKSRILYMRNFNNWIKSMLISEYLNKIKNKQKLGDPIRVLDMCCGKGGDLHKWEKGGITHLICTDIAEVSVEQCKTRYEGLMSRNNKLGTRFTAEFFACDATLVRLRERYADPSIKIHLVSCQFAFHYSFESLSQAECMVRNASECLQHGGFFIATIPDAYEIMRRLRNSSNSKSFGNEVYKIEFMCDTERPPLFGAKYQFHLEGVVDCPEFLVHFPTLVKLCRKHGLELVRKNSFADYYKESYDAGKTLLEKMQALQAYNASKDPKNDEQFAHVHNMTKSTKQCGTLSKSEWEAITLYSVCAFRKCKNTWDSEGRPVYEFES